MPPPSVLPTPSNWPSAIGHFILNFGALDYAVFVFLKDRIPAEEFAIVREYHFKDRLARIQKILTAPEYTNEQRQNFAKLIKKIEPLRELRNDLAHSHLHVTAKPEGNDVLIAVFNPKDVDLPSPKLITLEQVENSSAPLREAITTLQGLAGFEEKLVLRIPPPHDKTSPL